MLSGVQIRMARNALRWSVKDLADQSGVSTSTITRAETVDGIPATTRAKSCSTPSTKRMRRQRKSRKGNFYIYNQ